ncbi:MAG: hypothetical protein JWP29_4532 [Rhodoferax sp.]|nr:hypothetical protein [Rhodoferax sp.]
MPHQDPICAARPATPQPVNAVQAQCAPRPTPRRLQPRRHGLLGRVTTLLLAFAATSLVLAQAQTYPARPITLVVPFGAGSGTDITARTFAQAIGSELGGATVIVDNRGGANGAIAAQFVARAPADGYTLFMTTNTTQVANPVLYKKLAYDPVADFTPVTAVAKGAMVAVVPVGSPMKSIDDVIAAAKKNPGKMTFGSGSSSSRIAGELFKQMSHIDLLHVPYKSNPLALTDLIGGQIDVMFADTPTALPLVQGGKLKVLGYTGAKRSAALPQVPTLEELGIKGYESSYWIAVYAPHGTPPEIVRRLNDAFVKATRTALVKETYERVVYEIFTTSPEGLASFQQAEAEKWARTVKNAGIEAE